MKINFVSDANDPNYFVQAGEVAFSENGVELSTAGLQSCRALLVVQGQKRLLCHVYDSSDDKSKSTNPTELADLIRSKFKLPVTVYSATGCTQNPSQRTDLIVDEVVRLLDANHISLGTVLNSGTRVTTNLEITQSMRNPNFKQDDELGLSKWRNVISGVKGQTGVPRDI